MGNPLAGVTAKFDRAVEHIHELEAGAQAFMASEPYRITHRPDPTPSDAGTSRWQLAVFEVVKDPPLRLSVIAGEVLGQFRSALDHLMTQLVILRHPSQSENFPIYPVPGQFWQKSRPDSAAPCRAVRKAVRRVHYDFIEGLQPRGQDVTSGDLTVQGALARMQWFTNLDKHDVVRPAYLAPQRIATHSDPNVADFEWLIEPDANLYNGARLYRAVFVDESKSATAMELDITLTFGGGPYRWLPLASIEACGERTREIIEDLWAITPELGRELV